MIETTQTPEARRMRRVALGDLVYRTARRHGARTAAIDGDARIDYTELDARSSQFAHHLLQRVGTGRQVGMLCANSIDMLVATNGIHKAGQVWVPVNVRLDLESIGYVLRHAEVSAVVVDEALRRQPGMAELLASLGVPLIVTMGASADPAALTLADACAGRPETLPEVDIDDDQPALLMYTSGTTGHPKGVLHSHLSVYTAVIGNVGVFGLTERDVISGWLPLFHCAQHVLAAAACAAGSSLALARAFVPGDIVRLTTEARLTVFVGLPMMYAAVLADGSHAAPDFSALRLCVYAMAPMPAPLVKAIAERMAPHLLLATGQTEIYPITMSFDPLAHPGRDANYWGVSGLACETAVMDDDGRLLPPGRVGEIVHRGPNVMLGYFKDPQATEAARRFGWHHTGDLGMWDEGGQMLFLDRKKDMIKTGGENVASVKVEAVLLAHPAVAGAAVLGLPHPRWGEAVCAFVVRRPGAAVDEAALVEHCRARLAPFEVPKLVRFVDALPCTATGKVQKHLLRTQQATPAAGLWGDAAA